LESLRDKFEQLAEGPDRFRAVYWPPLFTHRQLWNDCLDLVRAGAAEDDLGTCWQLLQRDGLQSFVRSNGPALLDTVARTVAAAAAACLLRRATFEPPPDRLLLWLLRAAGEPDASVSSVALASFPSLDETERVDRAFALLPVAVPPSAWAAARYAVRALLELPPPPQRPGERFWVPLLLDHQSSPLVLRLWLERLRGGRGGLFLSPVQALDALDLDRSFTDALTQAWSAVGRDVPGASRFDVCWSLARMSPPERGPLPPLAGVSHQGAVAVALRLLLAGRSPDPSFAVAAAVANGKLLRVGGVKDRDQTKLWGACHELRRNSQVATVLVAPDNLPAEAERMEWLQRGLRVLAAEDVTTAADHVSGLRDGVPGYLESVRDLLLRHDQRPAYLGDHSFVEVYVAHRVLPEGADLSAPREWWQVLDGLGDGPARLALVWGDAGQGKTLLLHMSARRLARKGLRDLAGQRSSLHQVPLPVVVPLPRLASVAGRRRTPREALAEALRHAGHSEQAAGYVADHAHEPRTWLFLDALDEVATPERLNNFFAALREWHCRVVFTARSSWAERAALRALLPPGVVAYRLAPFADDQVSEFLRRWRPDEEQAARVDRLLRSRSPLRQVCQSPFLLTLLAWVAEAGEVSPNLTRARLYQAVLDQMLMQPLSGAQPNAHDRASAWRPLLAELAWGAFLDSGGRRPAGHEELVARIMRSDHGPLPLARDPSAFNRQQTAELLLRELVDRRLLFRRTASRGGSEYRTPHQSFHEHLTARALADLIEGRRASLPREGGPPLLRADVWSFLDEQATALEWGAVFLFLAGTLDDPGPLLRMLMNEERDGQPQRRMLVGQCFAEVPPDRLDADLVREVRQRWARAEAEGTGGALDHLRRLAALGPPSEARPDAQTVDLLFSGGVGREVGLALEAPVPEGTASPVDRFMEMAGEDEWSVRLGALEIAYEQAALRGAQSVARLLEGCLNADSDALRQRALQAFERLLLRTGWNLVPCWSPDEPTVLIGDCHWTVLGPEERR
jgi:hypothetical protein